MAYNGLINVYKEPGFTSFDAVAVLRGILKQKKIGHTGTLDPAAEGVLMVCLGNATKLCNMLEDKDKEYECTMLLGVTTDTEDTTGQELTRRKIMIAEAGEEKIGASDENNSDSFSEESNPICLSEDQIKNAILSFKGEIKQVPPMYSALKKDGKKLYELARQGIEIEREARDITIYDIEILNIDFPRVVYKVKCSKGTYIRSLCRDIGEKLGCGACMEHLKRTSVSFFDVRDSLTLKEIESLAKEGKMDDFILSTEEVFKDLDSVYVLEESKRIIDNGNPLQEGNIKTSETSFSDIPDGKKFKVYNSEGNFVAVYRFDKAKNVLMPEKMFQSL